jgi:hypothetical protein
MLFFLHQKNHNGKKEEILASGENGNGNGGEKKSKARTTKHMV